MSGAGRVLLGRGGEFDLIRAVLAEEGDPGPHVRVGPGDDALVLEGGAVVSCDLSMEDVHFRREWLGLREIGYRATAAALSDLAAMAARVDGALLSLAVPREGAREAVMELARGAREILAEVGGTMLGGDLSASPGPVVVDVVVLGRADPPVSRAGALPGDVVWVTGKLGGAAAAVREWTRGRAPEASLREAFARPRPRVAEALWLAGAVEIHALIDVSDGAAGDAGHLAAAGGVRIVLNAAAVPLHPSLAGVVSGAGEDALALGLHGGEDYELLFTAAEGAVDPVREEFLQRFGLDLTAVGRVEEGVGVHLVPADGGGAIPLERGGHSHFEER